MTETARILAALPLVQKLARLLKRARPFPWLDVDDLIQDGSIGLLAAVRRFEASRGVPFETFATPYIRGAMLEALRRHAWPRILRQQRRALETAREVWRQEATGTPWLEAVAAQLGWTVPYTRSVALRLHLAETCTLQGDPGPPLEVVVAQEDQLARLRTAVDQLPGPERAIVTGYYLKAVPLTVLALQLGGSVDQVTRLRTRAVQRLQARLA